MALILSLGSNQGDRIDFLYRAKELLDSRYSPVAQSFIYESEAVDYIDQPKFLNQLLEYQLPQSEPDKVMTSLLQIEVELGRVRDIPKGPRTIDIDIVFWGTNSIDTPLVKAPHPSWDKRDFVVAPLHELPYAKTLQKHFYLPKPQYSSLKRIMQNTPNAVQIDEQTTANATQHPRIKKDNT